MKARILKRKEGFTLIQLVVAVGIMLLLAAVSIPFLTKHTRNARVSAIAENVRNVKTALNAILAKPGINFEDENGDSDYLDDLVNAAAISKKPTYPSCSNWYVRRSDDGNGNYAYYIEIDVSNCPEQVQDDMEYYDEQTDDGNSDAGGVRT